MSVEARDELAPDEKVLEASSEMSHRERATLQIVRAHGVAFCSGAGHVVSEGLRGRGPGLTCILRC